MQADADGFYTLTLAHDSENEKQRFDNLDMPMDERDQAVLAGWKAAQDRCVQSIVQGRYGATDEEIEQRIEAECREDRRGLRRSKKFSRNAIYAYGVGFKSRMRIAKWAFLSRFVPDRSLSIIDLADDPELGLARMDGEGAGRRSADDLVRRARDEDLAVLREMVPRLQAAENAGAEAHEREGMPAAELAQWRIGFVQGAEPVVRAFLPEVQAVAEMAKAAGQVADGLSRMEAAAARLGVPVSPPAPPRPHALLMPSANRNDPLHRRLRPEDFGSMPTPSV